MDVSSNGSQGCFGFLLSVLVLIVSPGWIWLTWISTSVGESAAAVEPVPLAVAPTLEIVLGMPDDATSDEAQVAVDVVTRRLEALGVLLEPVVITAENTLIVRTDEGQYDTQTIIGALTQQTTVAFVDFSAVEQPEQYQNQPVPDGLETVISNADIASAAARLDDISGQWWIDVTFTTEAGERLGAFTEANIGETMAIVIDGIVISAPTIQARFDTGALITGNFTREGAVQLAAQLNGATLPFPLEVLRLTFIGE